MSKLQKLLDDRWANLPDDSRADHERKEISRRTFTEGYNAAKEEAKTVLQSSINNAYPGREGCTWGDTKHDSLAVAYGYSIALQDAQATLRTL